MSVMAASPSQSISSPASEAWSANSAFRVRLGAMCLLSAAALELLGLSFRGPLTSPAGDPAAFVRVSSSPTLHLGWGMLLPAAMLQCFGWLAVYRWRFDSIDERWAFRGMVLMLTSIIVFLPVSGALGLTSHEASLAETGGQHGAVALVAATAEGPFARKFLLVSVLTGLFAVGAWSRALWRVSRAGPWWASLLILHTITQSITSPMFAPWGYRLERLGAVAFLMVSVDIARRIFMDTSPRAVEATL